MEQQVREMEPILAKKAEESIALVSRLKVEQKAADKVKFAVMKDEAAAKVLLTYLQTSSYSGNSRQIWNHVMQKIIQTNLSRLPKRGKLSESRFSFHMRIIFIPR